MRDIYQYPKDPLRLSQGEETAMVFRNVFLVFLGLLVPVVLFATTIGGK